ncbi:hypothetical protein [Jannaschia sp. 2305UL9-9]|uniref:hypothetical protein n=1 Tax=Jannaschia sp. 2305UL9-9 TaxID=3121638 RepID=UPI0035281646
MSFNIARLFLSSVMIGIVAATALLLAVILFDRQAAGNVFLTLHAGTQALVWLYFAIAFSPFGTLFLLWRMRDD